METTTVQTTDITRAMLNGFADRAFAIRYDVNKGALLAEAYRGVAFKEWEQDRDNPQLRAELRKYGDAPREADHIAYSLKQFAEGVSQKDLDCWTVRQSRLLMSLETANRRLRNVADAMQGPVTVTLHQDPVYAFFATLADNAQRLTDDAAPILERISIHKLRKEDIK